MLEFFTNILGAIIQHPVFSVIVALSYSYIISDHILRKKLLSAHRIDQCLKIAKIAKYTGMFELSSLAAQKATLCGLCSLVGKDIRDLDKD
jgi:hypothetical protein